MLTILDAKDPAGSSVAAWYDSTNKRFIIGKSDHTGQMDLLTVAGKMAWFRQAGQAGLLFSETVPWVRAASMKHIADMYAGFYAFNLAKSVYRKSLTRPLLVTPPPLIVTPLLISSGNLLGVCGYPS